MLGQMRKAGGSPTTPGKVGHEGMDEWGRDKDNRLRQLRMRKECGDELTPEEQQEFEDLDRINQRFLDAGVQFGRGQGLRTLDTVFVLLGYSIGVGNLWRFPYLAAKHGGLVFHLAYFTCLMLVAKPIYMLELALGQDTRCGVVFCHRMIARRWVGVGYGFIVALAIIQGYYSMFLSYSLVYLGNSFVSPLPWSDEAFFDAATNKSSVPQGMTSAEYFWSNDVIGVYGNPGFGTPQWPLVVCLIISYIVIFFAIFHGIGLATKVAYVTVTTPAILLVVIVIWCMTLDGAGEGIKLYVGRFEAKELYNIGMWGDACQQALFSLLFLPGTTLTLSSYMQQKEDVYKIHNAVTAANAVFSFVGGFAVFAVIGHTAHKSCLTTGTTQSHTCRDAEDVAKASGAGLAFVALAEGISTIPSAANFFAFLFFLMCFCLGLDTCFAGIEVLNTFTHDNLIYFGKHPRTDLIAAASCVVLFLCGLMYCSSGGFFLLETVDHYLGTYVMLLGQFLQCLMWRLDWGWDRTATKLQLSTIGLPGFPRGREVPGRIGTLLTWVAPAMCIILAIGMFVWDCVEPFGERNNRSYDAGYTVGAWLLTAVVFGTMPLGWWLEVGRLHRSGGPDESIRPRKPTDIAVEMPLLEYEVQPALSITVEGGGPAQTSSRPVTPSGSGRRTPPHSDEGRRRGHSKKKGGRRPSDAVHTPASEAVGGDSPAQAPLDIGAQQSPQSDRQTTEAVVKNRQESDDEDGSV